MKRVSERYVTKPGQHGTLYRYNITYRDIDNQLFGSATTSQWAYSEEHVRDRWNDEDHYYFEVTNIERQLDS